MLKELALVSALVGCPLDAINNSYNSSNFITTEYPFSNFALYPEILTRDNTIPSSVIDSDLHQVVFYCGSTINKDYSNFVVNVLSYLHSSDLNLSYLLFSDSSYSNLIQRDDLNLSTIIGFSYDFEVGEGYLRYYDMFYSSNYDVQSLGELSEGFLKIVLDVSFYDFVFISNYTTSNEALFTEGLNFIKNVNSFHYNIYYYGSSVFTSSISSLAYSNGYRDGSNVAYSTLNKNSYNYQQGYNDALSKSSNFWVGLFDSVFLVPYTIINRFLDFDILGINLKSLLFGLLTFMLCLWLFKHLSGLQGDDNEKGDKNGS